jgi:uncharacterized protein YydD (DUF2326 family)
VLAHKCEGATDGHTRNGAGKSSLVEIINALLGSDIKKGSLLKEKALVDQFFGLKLDVNGEELNISRYGKAPSKIFVHKMPEGFVSLTASDDGVYTSNDEWLRKLGKEVFGLSESILVLKHSLSFRSLFSYFARSTKGVDSPEKTFPMQATWQSQVALTYLLKLDWRVARDFEGVRQKDKLIKALKQASSEGTLGDIMGTPSELSTEIHLKKDRAQQIKIFLADFKVLPEYQKKEARVAKISRILSKLSGEDTADKEWLSQLERTFEEEAVSDTNRLMQLFKDTELVFPELVARRFEEFTVFHASIVRNRREHLKQELEAAATRIEERYALKEQLDQERSEILLLLQSHGALDHYISLQSELSKLEADIELLERKVAATQNLDDQKSELKVVRSNLQKKMRIDLSEREDAVRRAVVSFAEISAELYEESGRFTIDPTDNGPRFEFDIPGKKSTGKSKMQIFCFDMMLMELWAEEPRRPSVLIHDSLIFDGVDERQKARALLIGAQMAKKYNFQYIVTMNSDDLPNMSEYKEFKMEDYLVDLNITDSESGGLFGIRF